MSGANAPVAKALQWCGWGILAYDWEISVEHDLGNTDLQQKLLSEVNEVDFWMVAMGCSTFSRARERPIPGHHNSPKPFRGAEHPLGLPGLSARDAERAKGANSIVSFFCTLLTAASKSGAAGMLENPLRAWLWAIAEVSKLLELPEWDDHGYWACALGGARAKGQRIRSNVTELVNVRCECRHITRRPGGSVVGLRTTRIDGATHQAQSRSTPRRWRSASRSRQALGSFERGAPACEFHGLRGRWKPAPRSSGWTSTPASPGLTP